MKIEKLSFAYGEKVIFNNLTLNLDSKRICLMSASGRGKTTLLKLIAGLEVPQGGRIEKDFTRCAVMFQDDRLLNHLTALENVACVRDKKDAENAKKLLDFLEIPENLYPNEMSGGMCRRVALARALHFGGDLMLLDEPFTGLDARLISKIADHLKSLNCRIIMTTHDKAEAELLDARIVNI